MQKKAAATTTTTKAITKLPLKKPQQQQNLKKKTSQRLAISSRSITDGLQLSRAQNEATIGQTKVKLDEITVRAARKSDARWK